MLTREQGERYLRHILLKEIGAQGQQRLLGARALVVGAGGLGAPVLQYLAAAGVGAISIVDDDAVSLSNLQRQVIYRTEDVGISKAKRAREAIAALNPDVDVTVHAARFDAENGEFLAGAHDIVIEGVDSFGARYTINRACIATRTPLVSAAVGRFEGQLAVFKPFAGSGLPCYRCLAPEPPPQDAQVNCAEEGVVGALTGVMGSLAAMEAIKEIVGIGKSLAGQLLLYDSLASRFRTVTLPADPDCPECGQIERG